MNQAEFEQEMMNEFEEDREDNNMDSMEDSMLDQQEWQNDYPVPEPDEKMNAHSFIHKATFASGDTIRTTFLHEQELGRPLFSVRFLMDLEDVSTYYMDQILKDLNLDPQKDNKITSYFWNKIQNITASGMSNKGFAMNLNVTRKHDSTRQRTRPPLPNEKVGDLPK